MSEKGIKTVIARRRGKYKVPDMARAVASIVLAHSCRSSLRLVSHKADPILWQSETNLASWSSERKAGRSSRGGTLLDDDATLMVTPGIKKTGVRLIRAYKRIEKCVTLGE